MYRGSTPTHVFYTNIDLTGATVYVTYAQNGETIVEKTGDDVTITSDSISVTLTQENTLKFNHNEFVRMQIRYVFENGVADASNIIKIHAREILKDGVIPEGDENV